jgi:hypothetical protein
MRQNVRVVRGLGVAVVSVFLIAGAAFAADGFTRQPRQVTPAAVGTSEPAETAEPTETVDPAETAAG